MASSNVIQTVDQTGKLKYQNLDSAFGGKYEDLLTLGAGEVGMGVVPAVPYKEVAIATVGQEVAVSGPCKVLFVNATAADGVVDISGLKMPVGTAFNILVQGGESVAIAGLGLDITIYGLQFFLMQPDGTLYWWD
jgi:hypothetical protein